MTAIDTAKLEGIALLWAFSRVLGRDDPIYRYDDGSIGYIGGPDRMGPLKPDLQATVERFRLHLCPVTYNDEPAFEAWVDDQPKARTSAFGINAMDAAMRSVVLDRFGDTAEVPSEVLEFARRRSESNGEQPARERCGG
ncbi:hypothetical protein [Ramlibacter sp. AN1133]|uniref:hypothetical protein n=1 Tax=Ramlibacter sp. AN1133 TaxID=3133429 RepID=UPI0030C2D3AF